MEYYEKWRKGELTVREGAECLNMSYTTFFRRCKEQMEMEEGEKNNEA